MNLNKAKKDRKFVVYVHTSPKGKKYVGITSTSLKSRCGCNGEGYKHNKHFWGAINKYGWDNFKHEIIAENLSVERACELEQYYIALYDSTDPKKGYNITTGGEWYSIPEHFLYKWRGHSSWCKGLTKDTDPRLKAMSEKYKTREVLPEWKAKMSAARKAQYENGYAPRWINNGTIETQIQEGDPIPEGFTKGRLSILDTYIRKGSQSKKISHNELDKYLSEGWEKGRPDTVSENIRKSLQIMHWEYEGMRFETAKQLAKYLNENGYPAIVDSTITSLYKKGFDKSPKYSSLEGKIRCVRHEN